MVIDSAISACNVCSFSDIIIIIIIQHLYSALKSCKGYGGAVQCDGCIKLCMTLISDHLRFNSCFHLNLRRAVLALCSSFMCSGRELQEINSTAFYRSNALPVTQPMVSKH